MSLKSLVSTVLAAAVGLGVVLTAAPVSAANRTRREARRYNRSAYRQFLSAHPRMQHRGKQRRRAYLRRHDFYGGRSLRRDADGDGVPNRLDRRPRNVRRH